jgi:hypothetical protein
MYSPCCAQVDRLNRDYYKTSGTALQANQVGSHVMLSKAIIGLKGDEHAFSCRCHIVSVLVWCA